MAVGTVHAIEHNTHKVNIEHLAQYAKAVGTTLQHLLPETRGMDTLLTDLVRKQTANAVLGAISSTIDAVVEELAQEILRDPAFREQMQQVIRTAFAQTLQDLNAPPKDDPDGQ